MKRERALEGAAVMPGPLAGELGRRGAGTAHVGRRSAAANGNKRGDRQNGDHKRDPATRRRNVHARYLSFDARCTSIGRGSLRGKVRASMLRSARAGADSETIETRVS